MPSRSSLRTILPPVSVAETAFGGGQPQQAEQPAQLGEPDCDIDSLKKLKLGLRSSLWSRPAGQQGNPSSDYSIAV